MPDIFDIAEKQYREQNDPFAHAEKLWDVRPLDAFDMTEIAQVSGRPNQPEEMIDLAYDEYKMNVRRVGGQEFFTRDQFIQQNQVEPWLKAIPKRRSFVDNIKESYKRTDENIELELAAAYAISRNKADFNKVRDIYKQHQLRQHIDPIEGNWFERMFYGAAGIASGIIKSSVSSADEALAGALAGATAAAIGGQAGPQVALPEEVVTVPVTATAGATVGYTTGMVDFWHRQGTGAMLLDMVDAGYDAKTSHAVAYVASIPYAAMEMLQIKQLAPGTRKLTQNALQRSTLAIMGKFAKNYGGTLGAEVLEEMAQELIQIGAKDIAGVLDENADVEFDQEHFEDIVTQLYQVGKESLISMALLPLPGAAIDVYNGKKSAPDPVTKKKLDAPQTIELLETQRENIRNDTTIPDAQKEQLYVKLDEAIYDLQEQEAGPIEKTTDELGGEIGPVVSESQILPEPRQVPIEIAPDRVEVKEFREATIISDIGSPMHEMEQLGVEPLIKPAIEGKQRFDREYRKIRVKTRRMIEALHKSAKTSRKEQRVYKKHGEPTSAMIEMAEALNTYEEAPAHFNEEQITTFNYFRTLSRELITRENQIRRDMGVKEIPYRTGYFRHVSQQQVDEILNGEVSVPPEIEYFMEEHFSSKVYNPTEKKRMLGSKLEELYSRDLEAVTNSMTWFALREIHLKTPLKTFEAELANIPVGNKPGEIPVSTAKWAERFIKTYIRGEETRLDKNINALITKTGFGRALYKILHPFSKNISKKPITNLGKFSGRMVTTGALWMRPKLWVRNMFQKTHDLALYTLDANMKGKILPMTEQMEQMINESEYFKSYSGIEELDTASLTKLEKLGIAPYQWTAQHNAKTAMKTAYWDWLDLLTNPQYKSLGNQDPQRTYTEPKGFLYPSEKAKILKEMEFGAGTTQFQYLPMAMPGIFKHKTLVPLTRLTSWWQNYFFRFQRESLIRLITGRTTTGIKLPMSRRVGYARYVTLGGTILTSLGYSGSFLLGALPHGLSPVAQLVMSMYKWITSGDDRERKRQESVIKNTIPVVVPGGLSAKDVNAVWSGEKDINEFFRYAQEEDEERDNVWW